MSHKPEFLADTWDLLCDSFQMGDLDYWTNWIEVYREDGFVLLREEEGGVSDAKHKVRRDDLERGLGLLRAWAEELEERDGYDAMSCASYSLTGLRTQDAGEFDSITADVLVQLMLFGEVVYG